MRWIIVSLTVLLTACGDVPAPRHFEDIRFTQAPQIAMDVAEIRIIESQTVPTQAPHVAHRFPTPPVQALKNWAGDRLRAVGSEGIFEFVIQDASVTETALRTDDSLSGLFKEEQSERYDARIRVVLRLYSGARGIAQTQGDVTVTRMRTISEEATVVEREQLFDTMLRDIMEVFNREAEDRLQQYFSPYLRP
jgi:hypothetical protein